MSNLGDVVLEHATYTVEKIIERLKNLERRLDQEGRYTDANVAWLAVLSIEQLRKAFDISMFE